jgi:hypothetical protein
VSENGREAKPSRPCGRTSYACSAWIWLRGGHSGGGSSSSQAHIWRERPR